VLELLPSIQPAARVAIIAMNDDAATGALNAFERAGRLDQVVAVGQNADLLGRAALSRPGLPFIGSTAYRPERYGDRLIELALRLLRGEAVPPAVYCHHTFISRENLEQYYPTGGAGAPPTLLPSALLARETRAG
jgi:ribose transport system substrate-binding protein